MIPVIDSTQLILNQYQEVFQTVCHYCWSLGFIRINDAPNSFLLAETVEGSDGDSERYICTKSFSALENDDYINNFPAPKVVRKCKAFIEFEKC